MRLLGSWLVRASIEVDREETCARRAGNLATVVEEIGELRDYMSTTLFADDFISTPESTEVLGNSRLADVEKLCNLLRRLAAAGEVEHPSPARREIERVSFLGRSVGTRLVGIADIDDNGQIVLNCLASACHPFV